MATVKVEALKPHSYEGKNYEVGDEYDIDEQYVESVAGQGMAVRVDRVSRAKEERKAAEKTLAAREATARGATTGKRGRPAKGAKVAKAKRGSKRAK